MDESNTNCPKCSAEMEAGFILDHTHDNDYLPSKWVEGEPIKSFWTGTKISDKSQYRVVTLRCVRCGFLESYATEEITNKSVFS